MKQAEKDPKRKGLLHSAPRFGFVPHVDRMSKVLPVQIYKTPYFGMGEGDTQ